MERLKEFLEWHLQNPHNVNLKMIVAKEDREDTLKVMHEISELLDTGLDPDKIQELKDRDTAKMCKQSIFDHDSITCVCGSDMDKGVEFMFCPWCGQRLKKWED